jgi:DNA-binding LacI/PurR family transcriptional regulator
MAMTFKDIARRGRVSATTVSFALRGQRPGRPPLTNDTILRIHKIAGQLGYRTNTLGVLFSNLSFSAEELPDGIKNVILPIVVKLRSTIGSIAKQ